MTTLTIIVVIVLVGAVAAAFALADSRLYASFIAGAARIRAAIGTQPDTLVTEQDLKELPEPMARYLRWSGVLGKKRISAVHLRHSGTFKLERDRPWMPIQGEYYVTTTQPTFAWYGKLRMAPGITAVALDSYANGRGRMLVRLMSAFTITDDRSEQVSHSAFGRCIVELAATAPTFFLDRDRVKCEQTGPDTVQCAVTDGRFSADANLVVNRDGSLDRIVVMRYFDRGNGLATLERFTGKISQPKSYAGIMLGSRMDGSWNLHEGDFHYVSYNVDSVEFH